MIVNDNHIWQAPKKHHKVHVCVCVCVCVCRHVEMDSA